MKLAERVHSLQKAGRVVLASAVLLGGLPVHAREHPHAHERSAQHEHITNGARYEHALNRLSVTWGSTCRSRVEVYDTLTPHQKDVYAVMKQRYESLIPFVREFLQTGSFDAVAASQRHRSRELDRRVEQAVLQLRALTDEVVAEPEAGCVLWHEKNAETR